MNKMMRTPFVLLAGLALTSTGHAQSANPASRPGPPPRVVTVRVPCPDGQVYDLDVCVPALSEEAAAQCRTALESAAMAAPSARARLLVEGCTAVSVPVGCNGEDEPGVCTLALCELEREDLRPGICAVGDVPTLIAGMECQFDVIGTLPSILSELAPDARVITAEIAAMGWVQDSLLTDPSQRQRSAALALDNALTARQSLSVFIAYRFAMCE
jgi:hypothetical protein